MTHESMTRGSQHPRVMLRSVEVVSLIEDDQWELPTPCSEWNLRELVEHMILDNRGFAAAAGGPHDRSVWTLATFKTDLRAEYSDSAEKVMKAFENPVPEFWLPRIDDTVTYPAAQAISYHLLDYLVHAWDVAASIGQRITFDEDLIESVQTVGDRYIPNGPNRFRVGRTFHPVLPPEPGESTLDHLLRTLGRSPRWPN